MSRLALRSCPDPADAGPRQPWPGVFGDIKQPQRLWEKVAQRARELRPDRDLEAR